MRKFEILGAKAFALALMFGGATVAHAADGTITFNGEITGTTCTISVNGATADRTVTLPTVSTSALPSAALRPVARRSRSRSRNAIPLTVTFPLISSRAPTPTW